VFVWVGCLLGGSAAVAQPARALTVDDWVALAMTSNPELRAARAELEAAGGRVRQAALRPNPTLDLGGQRAIGPDNSLSVGLTLPLDLNGRKQGRVGVAEREVEVRRAQLADRERRLRADVRVKAGDVLAARRTLEVTDELLAVSRNALTLVAERVRQGAAPALDENLMHVEVNRLEAGRLIQAGRAEVAALQLKALAGAPPDELLEVQGDLSSPPRAPEPGNVLGRAVDQRPDIWTARAEVATAQARMRKEQADGQWDASVNIGYQRQDMGFNLRGLTDTGATRQIQDVFHYFGAGVSVVLPVRNRNEGNIAAASAEAVAAERRREFSELVARQEVAAALAQTEAARRTVELYERGVRGVARANVEVVRQSYGLGRATLLDVIAEQRRYIEVENGYTDVLREAWNAAVELERAVGAPVQ
jgi:cobalt-zinc-cadmium efflux system outer membrane protein